MRKKGRTKEHFIRTKLVVEIEKLRQDGNSYKKIAKILSMRFRKHFSVGLVFLIYNKKKR